MPRFRAKDGSCFLEGRTSRPASLSPLLLSPPHLLLVFLLLLSPPHLILLFLLLLSFCLLDSVNSSLKAGLVGVHATSSECVCVCVCAYTRVCVGVYTYICVCVCERVRACVQCGRLPLGCPRRD